MQKYWSALILGIMLVVNFSCSNENSEFGLGLVEGVSVQFEDLDTLDVNLATVKFDTLVTSNIGRMLVGKSDARADRPGDLEAKAYFTVGRDNVGNLNLDGGNNEFDSATMYLTFDGYYNGDSSQMVTYKIVRLDDVLEYTDEVTSFYSFSNRSFDTNKALGTKTLMPTPKRQSSFEIRLDDDFGRELFDLYRDNDDLVSSSELLRDYLKGFVLLSEQTHQFVAGFSPSLEMRLYYTINNGASTLQQILNFDISIAIGNIRKQDVYYTGYDTDFSGSEVVDLNTMEDRISSTVTGKTAFLSAARGLAVRVDLPSLYLFAEQLDNEFINSTVLTIKPDFIRGIDPNLFMETLNVFKVDEDNEIIGTYGTSGQLRFDEEFNTNTYYEISVAAFIEEQLADAIDNGNGLLLVLDNAVFNSTVESMLIGDNKNRDLKSNLSINIIKRKDE